MKSTKTIFIILVNLAALLLLAVGLISPLTPPEGIPSSIELFIFAICPIVILCLLAWFAKSKWVKVVFVVEIIIIVVLLIKVLGVVYHSSKT
jgi:hypothetical protein